MDCVFLSTYFLQSFYLHIQNKRVWSGTTRKKHIYIRKAFFLFFEVYKSVGINQMERDLLNKFKPSQFYIIHNKSCNDNLNVTEGTEHQICANRLVVCEPPHINT